MLICAAVKKGGHLILLFHIPANAIQKAENYNENEKCLMLAAACTIA